MAINRYDVPATQATGQDYFRLPINEMLGTLATKQKKQDDSLSKLNDLSGLLETIKSLDPSVPGASTDRQLHQNLVNTVRNDINDLYNIDLTSKEGNKELYKRINNIKRHFDPSGEAYKLTERYNTYNAKNKAIAEDKILDKRPDIARYAQNALMVGDINSPDYNKTNGFNYVAPIDPKEMQDGFSALLKDVATTTLSEGELHKYNLDPTNYLYELSNRDGRLYNTIVESAARRIPKEWYHSTMQDAVINGGDPNYENDVLEYDANGQAIVDPKTKTYKLRNNTLGRQLQGIGIGGQFSKLENKVGHFEDYAAKHKIDNPVANFLMTTQGLEYKPASGENTVEYKAYKNNLGIKKAGILNPYIDKLFPGLGNTKTFNDVLALDDATLHAAGLSREMLLKDKKAYDNLSSVENIVNQRDANLEKKAAESLGINYNDYVNTRNTLPDVPGISRQDAFTAIDTRGRLNWNQVEDRNTHVVSNKYYLDGKEISKPAAEKIMKDYIKLADSPEGKKYLEYQKNTKKVQDKKADLMKSQVTLDNTVTSKFPGNPKIADAITESVNKAVNEPYLWSELPLVSSEIIDGEKVNGQTLQQLIQKGVISSVNDVKVSQVGITQQPIDVDPDTREPHYGIRVGISIPDKEGKMSKPYEVILSTKNFTTPELTAEMNGPRVQASKEYIQARAEGSNKGVYNSYDFAPFNVQYNFDNNTVGIMGLKFSSSEGLEKLALIQDAINQGIPIANIKADLPKILK